MAFINIRSWTNQEVAEWMKGLDDCLGQYIEGFVDHGVTGEKLLQLTQQDLEALGVVKIGHQEILFASLSLLCGLNFGLENENLQYLSLSLSCKANNLKSLIKCNKFCTHFERRSEVNSDTLANDVLKLITEVVTAIRTLVSWLDRSPFSEPDHFRKLRKAIVQLGLELTSAVQLDIPASDIEDTILPVSIEIVRLCDKLIKESRDPLVIQPAHLELTTLKKKRPEESLGMMIKATYEGVHVITGTKDQSPAELSRKVHAGDEVVQVNYRTVVGWQLNRLVEALKEDPHEVTLTLKKRPKNTLMPGQVLIKKSVLNVNEKKKLHTAPSRRRQSGTEKKLKSPLEQLFIPPPPEEPYSPRTSSDEPLQSFSIVVPDSPNYKLDKQFKLEQNPPEEPEKVTAAIQSRRCTVSEVTLRKRRVSGGGDRLQHAEGRPKSLPADTADLTEITQLEVKAWEAISLEKRNSISQESKSSEKSEKEDKGTTVQENKQTYTNQIEVYIVGSQENQSGFHVNHLGIGDIVEKADVSRDPDEKQSPLIKTNSIEHLIECNVALQNGSSVEQSKPRIEVVGDLDSPQWLRSSIRLQTDGHSGLRNDILRSSVRLQTGDYTDQNNAVKDSNEKTDTEATMDSKMPEIKDSEKVVELEDPPKSKNLPLSSPESVDDTSADTPHKEKNTVPKIEQQMLETAGEVTETTQVPVPRYDQRDGHNQNGTVPESQSYEHSVAGSRNWTGPKLSSPSMRSDISVASTVSTFSTVGYRVENVGGKPVQFRDPSKVPVLMRKKNRRKAAAGVDRRVSCQDLGMGECEGWLYKKEDRRGFGNKWPKRWCVLKDYSVFYYKDKNALIASGVISIPGYKISQASPSETKRPFAFKVSHPRVRDFIFASDSLSDMSKWMNKLSLASITYDYKEEEEKEKQRRARMIPENIEPPPSPVSPTSSECPYFSESEGEEEKNDSPTASVRSSQSDLSKEQDHTDSSQTEVELQDHTDSQTEHRLQGQGHTEEESQGQIQKDVESESQIQNEPLNSQEEEQNQSESQSQKEDCAQLDPESQTEDHSEGQVENQDQDVKSESPSQVEDHSQAESQDKPECVTQSDDQGQTESHAQAETEYQIWQKEQDQAQGRATVNLPLRHPDTDDSAPDIKSDGLLRLYGSMKSAKVKVGGVETAMSRQNMSQPERLRSFSIVSRDPKKNEKMLKRRALERTLKAKESELQDIDRFLESEISRETLRVWKEHHPDVFSKHKGAKDKHKSAQKAAKSSPKPSSKSSPVMDKTKKKAKHRKKSATDQKHSDMQEKDNDESASDDKNYHETHL